MRLFDPASWNFHSEAQVWVLFFFSDFKFLPNEKPGGFGKFWIGRNNFINPPSTEKKHEKKTRENVVPFCAHHLAVGPKTSPLNHGIWDLFCLRGFLFWSIPPQKKKVCECVSEWVQQNIQVKNNKEITRTRHIKIGTCFFRCRRHGSQVSMELPSLSFGVGVPRGCVRCSVGDFWWCLIHCVFLKIQILFWIGHSLNEVVMNPWDPYNWCLMYL